MLGDEPPSPEQWQTIRKCLSNTIGPIVAAKLLDKADELSEQSKLETEKMKLYQQQILAMQMMKQNTARNNQVLGPQLVAPYGAEYPSAFLSALSTSR